MKKLRHKFLKIRRVVTFIYHKPLIIEEWTLFNFYKFTISKELNKKALKQRG